MDEYMVNGVAIRYDAFDLDNFEKWDDAVKHVESESKKPRGAEESETDQIRRVCYAMQDFFDVVCGDGTAQSVFGETVNIKAIYEGYVSFAMQVTEKMEAFFKEVPAMFQKKEPVTPLNRAQRRRDQHSRR